MSFKIDLKSVVFETLIDGSLRNGNSIVFQIFVAGTENDLPRSFFLLILGWHIVSSL